jgi:hypothetical protein
VHGASLARGCFGRGLFFARFTATGHLVFLKTGHLKAPPRRLLFMCRAARSLKFKALN